MVLFDTFFFFFFLARWKSVTISYAQDQWQCQAHLFPPFLSQDDPGPGLEAPSPGLPVGKIG